MVAFDLAAIWQDMIVKLTRYGHTFTQTDRTVEHTRYARCQHCQGLVILTSSGVKTGSIINRDLVCKGSK